MDRPMSGTYKLLIVDDDPGSRDWLAAFGDQLGYEILLAGSGEEALVLAAEVTPDVVTLDVLLPGLGGIETLKALHELHPELPVIMLSGHADVPMAVGFDSYYTTKPSGMGLGLAICRLIVEGHGGEMGLDDSGSVISLLLPAQS